MGTEHYLSSEQHLEVVTSPSRHRQSPSVTYLSTCVRHQPLRHCLSILPVCLDLTWEQVCVSVSLPRVFTWEHDLYLMTSRVLDLVSGQAAGALPHAS